MAAKRSDRKSAPKVIDTRRSRRRPAAKKPERPRRRWRWFILKWVATLAVWAVVAVAGMAAWFARDLPDIQTALAAQRRPTITLIAADGSVLASRGDVYAKPVQLKDLPPYLPAAVVATEDRRFYHHFGLDPIGLARAMWANLRAGHVVQGGSTITQQVAKNLFLTPDRTIKRKVQELMLALWLEHKLTKQQILTVYLNRVYLGAGTYGVEAAARRYFGRSARNISLYQAAILAGLPKAPSRYNPVRNPDLAAARAKRVLAAMVDAGVLDPARAAAAARQAAAFARTAEDHVGGRHFADWVLDQVPDYVVQGNRDLTVITTLDPALQRIAQDSVESTLKGPAVAAKASEAALVAIAPDGAVRAMVGGRDYGLSQFNRATQARRQPGSAFKPIVYLAGLEAGLTPSTVMEDAPITIDGWSPANFSREYAGRVSLSEALARSLNTVAVRVAERAGLKRVVALAHRLGITSRLPDEPSLALGTGEVSLLEMTAAYGTFANDGIGLWPYGILEIRDRAGRLLYKRSGSGPGRLIPRADAEAMNRMLAGVIRHGTGRAAALDRPVAGKTGTSQNFRDAWFIGYTADLVCGVWMGNDDGSPMHHVTGGGLPARLWHGFMAAANRRVPVRPLPGVGD